MAKHKTPGVFINQVQKLPNSVAQVETAIPAFIGYTEKAILTTAGDLLNSPKRIINLDEYRQFFGEAEPEQGITVEVHTQGGGTQLETNITNPSNYLMYYALQAFFANGGGPCYIVSVGNYSGGGAIDRTALLSGLAAAGEIDEITLIVFPEGTNMASAADYHALVNESLSHCHERRDRFLVCDLNMSDDPTIDEVEEFRAGITVTTDELSYGACYYPYLDMSLDYHFHPADVQVTKNGNTRTLDQLEKRENELFNEIQSAISAIPLTLPSSAPVLGIYARMDAQRGVWKAPANVSITGAVRPNKEISNSEQESLNVDPVSGKSINAIRTIQNRGVMVWGARTLAGNDNEWRYVPVRRFYNMVEESITKAMRSFVFEPNDANTWLEVKRMVGVFLTDLWRQGALAGSKPEHAFVVRVGLGETMTAKDVRANIMNVEIGMAVIRPAEFTILRISQKMGGS